MSDKRMPELTEKEYHNLRLIMSDKPGSYDSVLAKLILKLFRADGTAPLFHSHKKDYREIMPAFAIRFIGESAESLAIVIEQDEANARLLLSNDILENHPEWLNPLKIHRVDQIQELWGYGASIQYVSEDF